MASITALAEPHRLELELAHAGEETITEAADTNGVTLILTELEARELERAREAADVNAGGGRRVTALVNALERLGRVRYRRLESLARIVDAGDEPQPPTLADLADRARRRMDLTLTDTEATVLETASAVTAWRGLDQAAREEAPVVAAHAATLEADALAERLWRRIAGRPGGSTQQADAAVTALREELAGEPMPDGA